MKIQVFKQNSEMVVRVGLTGTEVDRFLTQSISAHGPGLARYATTQNCRPLFETPDRTYQIRLPAHFSETGDMDPHRD